MSYFQQQPSNYRAAPAHGRRSNNRLDNESKIRAYAGIECSKVNLYDVVMEALRKKIVERAGVDSINAFGLRFNIMDDLEEKDGQLSSYELHNGLKQVGLDINKKDCEDILRMVDTNGNGSVCYTEFLIALRGKINKRRMDLIDRAFMQLGPMSDPQKGQVVTLAQMTSIYDPSCSPDVKSGKKTPQEVMRKFVNQFDQNQDGIITIAEFRHYFKNVSSCISNDDEFELMIRNAWHISGGKGAVENTSNLRVGVTFNDGSYKVIEVKNDMGLDRNNPKAIKKCLYGQGVHCINKIHLSAGFEA